MPLTVSGAARRVSARARGVARHTGAGPTSALPGPAPIDGRRPSKSLRLYTAAAGGCPAWWLGCPSLTAAVVWPAGGCSPDRSFRLFTLGGPLRRTFFPRARHAQSENFPNARAPPRTPPPLAPGTRWAQAASRPVFWAPPPLSLTIPFASEKGDGAQDLPSLVRSADPMTLCPAQIAPKWGRVGAADLAGASSAA